MKREIQRLSFFWEKGVAFLEFYSLPLLVLCVSSNGKAGEMILKVLGNRYENLGRTKNILHQAKRSDIWEHYTITSLL